MSGEFCTRSCVPCQGGIPPLSEAAAQALMPQIPEWTLTEEGRRLRRRIAFPDFRTALDFVSRVGELAEREGHHPDISFGWGWAEIVWSTHEIDGLHENDFIMAARTSRLLDG